MAFDVAKQIRSFNAGREPERLQRKYAAMRESPFAFLRGTCHLFYARMARGGVHKTAPNAWVCGDLHLENFGSYEGDNRLAYFDINDFDETALAPATWDLVRLLASVQLGAAMLRAGDSQVTRLCETFTDSYADALALGKAFWVERDTATGLVRELLNDLRGRDRTAFIAKRLEPGSGKRVLKTKDKKHALKATDAQRRCVVTFMREFAKTQPDPSFFEVIDVARRVAGTGSLGVERYVILVRGEGSPDRNHLLDLKASSASSLAPRLQVVQPKFASNAARIVALQRRLQAVPMDFLQAVTFVNEHGTATPAVLRGLQPGEDRVELPRAGGDMKSLGALLATMGRIVAWAQLRSAGQGGSASVDALIDFGRRKKWRALLLAASRECAAQVVADAQTYNAAYDRGFFSR